MAHALEVAKYFLVLAGNDEEQELLTHMRLQKLLYYAQGWSLALRDKPLFDEEIEAWTWGPVVSVVYQEYKQHGRDGIRCDEIGDIVIDDDERELIQAVWNEFKQFSAIKLSQMTHDEPPWKEAQPQAVITTAAISRYFKSLVATR